MKIHQDLHIIMKDEKTGREIKQMLDSIPRIGEGVVPDQKTLWRVTDIVHHCHWYNQQSVYHETTIYVKKGKR